MTESDVAAIAAADAVLSMAKLPTYTALLRILALRDVQVSEIRQDLSTARNMCRDNMTMLGLLPGA